MICGKHNRGLTLRASKELKLHEVRRDSRINNHLRGRGVVAFSILSVFVCKALGKISIPRVFRKLLMLLNEYHQLTAHYFLTRVSYCHHFVTPQNIHHKRIID